MSISEHFRYRNDVFQSDIFVSDIGITDVDVGCRISPKLRSISMPTYAYEQGKFQNLRMYSRYIHSLYSHQLLEWGLNRVKCIFILYSADKILVTYTVLSETSSRQSRFLEFPILFFIFSVWSFYFLFFLSDLWSLGKKIEILYNCRQQLKVWIEYFLKLK